MAQLADLLADPKGPVVETIGQLPALMAEVRASDRRGVPGWCSRPIWRWLRWAVWWVAPEAPVTKTLADLQATLATTRKLGEQLTTILGQTRAPGRRLRAERAARAAGPDPGCRSGRRRAQPHRPRFPAGPDAVPARRSGGGRGEAAMRRTDRRHALRVGAGFPLALAGCAGCWTRRKAPAPTEYRLTPKLDLPGDAATRATGC